MRIAYATDNYWPRVSGMAVSIDAFRNELAERGHQVHVLAPEYPDLDWTVCPADNAHIHRFRAFGLRSLTGSEDRLVSPMERDAVGRALQRIRPDVIHVQTEFTMGRLACEYAKQEGIPLVMTAHTHWEEYIHCYAPWFPEVLGRYGARHYMRYTCNIADCVIAPTEQMKLLLRSYGVRRPIEVIPTGFKICEFFGASQDDEVSESAVFEEFPQPKRANTLGFAGRLGTEKNVDFLLEVLKFITPRYPEVVLQIAGDGPARRHLELRCHREGLGGRVAFLGFLDKRRMREFYANIDVFVMPSKTEGQGLVTTEAMLCGTPVVGIAAMGTLGVMGGDNGGFMVDDDVEDFAAKVCLLLDDADLRARKTSEALRRAREFTIEASATRVETLYRDQVGGRTVEKRELDRTRSSGAEFKRPTGPVLITRVRTSSDQPHDTQHVHGHVEPGFDGVHDVFTNAIHRGDEIGAACAIYFDGRCVVDLWGGYADRDRGIPWRRDTLQLVLSATKGLVATCFALLASRGQIDYDAPVARYWRAFGRMGKTRITVRQLLNHQAGLPCLSRQLTFDLLSDREAWVRLLERQTPLWEPGSAIGYHAVTLGLYLDELLRRIDGRTLSEYFAHEIATPCSLDCHVGLPREFDARVSTVYWPGVRDVTRNVLPFLLRKEEIDHPFLWAALNPFSMTSRAFNSVRELRGTRLARFNDPLVRRLNLPSAIGYGTARSMARLYGALASGGSLDGRRLVTPQILQEVANGQASGLDLVLRGRSAFSLGFARPAPVSVIGKSPRSFGFGGAGGSMSFADPDARIGFSYVMNRMGHRLADPRFLALRDATYACLERVAGRGAVRACP